MRRTIVIASPLPVLQTREACYRLLVQLFCTFIYQLQDGRDVVRIGFVLPLSVAGRRDEIRERHSEWSLLYTGYTLSHIHNNGKQNVNSAIGLACI